MKKYLFLLIVLVLFFSCENDTSSPSDPGPTQMGLDGLVQKGPFITGSTIIVQELNDEFSPNGTSFNVTTEDNFGSFSLNSEVSTDFIEVISEGFYFNEVSGVNTDTELTLRALSGVSDSLKCNINILTTLAKKRIVYLINEEDKTYSEAKQQAQNEILDIFSVHEAGVEDFEKMDISQNRVSDAILLAISVVLQGSNSVSELSLLISTIIEDIKEDGILDDLASQNEILENAKYLSLPDLRNNIETYYQSLGLALTVPDFEKYVRNLWVNTPPTCLIDKLESEIMVYDMYNPIDTLSVFNNDTLYIGSEIDIQVIAEDEDGSITKVEIYVNDRLIDDTSFGSFSWVITDTTRINTVKVIAYDDDGETCADSLEFILHGTARKEIGLNPANSSVIYITEFDNKIWIKPRSTQDLWCSDDYITWNKTTAAIPWTDNTFEMISYHDTLWTFANSTVYNSTDGIVWNTLTASISFTTFSVTVFNDKIWLCDGNGELWNTLDGINWDYVKKIDNYTTDVKLFAFNEKLWVVRGSKIANSVDGSTWVYMTDLITQPCSNYGPQILANNEKIYFEDMNYNLWSSLDGEIWEKVNIPLLDYMHIELFIYDNKLIIHDNDKLYYLKRYFE